MLELYKLEDSFEVKTLLNRDELYKGVLGLDSIEEWNPEFNLTAWFEVKQDNQGIGLIILRDFSYNTITFHGGLFKKYRSPNSHLLLKNCLDFFRQQKPYKFITTVNAANKAAIRLAKKAGFRIGSIIPNGCEDNNLLIFVER